MVSFNLDIIFPVRSLNIIFGVLFHLTLQNQVVPLTFMDKKGKFTFRKHAEQNN